MAAPHRVLKRLETNERPKFSHRFTLGGGSYPSATAAATALKIAISAEAVALDGVEYASYGLREAAGLWCAFGVTARGFYKFVGPA